MSTLPGTILDGRYEVEAAIASGGHAEVLRARHLRLDSLHAVKVLHDTTREQRARLLEEGRIQARLVHPNIVRVTDVIELEGADGDIALVMDFVEGDSLSRWLSRRGRPSVAEARRIGTAILRGVATAHAQGLVHRDLKPHNVLMEPHPSGDVPRVADFGLAKAMAPKAGDVSHTRAGIGMGTPAYMAPEQFIDASSVDLRADVFSLGAVLYELATGQRAFQADKALELYQQVQHRRYAPLDQLAPDLPADMARAILAALEPDRERRLPDVGALLALWTGEDAPTTPVEPPTTPVVPVPASGGRTHSTFAFDPVAEGIAGGNSEPDGAEATDGRDSSTMAGFALGLDEEPSARPTPPEAAPTDLPRTDVTPPLDRPPLDRPPLDRPPVVAPAAAPADGRGPRRLAAAAGLVLAPAVLGLVQATAPLDMWANARLLALASGELPADRAVLLTIPEDQSPRALRAAWPDTLARLSDAGVASVTFDLAFSAEDPADPAFAAAVNASESAGVPVIAPGRWADGALVPPGTDALADALRVGLAEVETEGLYRVFLGRIPAHRWHPVDGDIWHISVLTVQSWTPSMPGPALDEVAGLVEVGPTRTPAASGRMRLHPVAPPVEAIVTDPGAWPDLRGKAVVIGAMSDRDRFWTRAGVVQGAALQAAAIETLASGRAPRDNPAWLDALAALLTALAGLGLARTTGRAWLAPAPVLLALFWAATRAQAGAVGGLLPLLLAGLCGWLAVRLLRP